LTRNDVNTSQTQVAFTWTAPASNGGSAVIDYTIELDQGTGTYVLTATGVTATSYTKTGLSSGTSYNFKVRARNIIGVGSLTSAFTIVAATVPSAPSALTRDSVNTSKTQVAFTWTAPTQTGGVAIIDYTI
jgi:titin